MMALQGTRNNRNLSNPAAVRAPVDEMIADLITQEMAERMFLDGIIPYLATPTEVGAGDLTTKGVTPYAYATNQRIPYSFNFPGTLAANVVIRFTIPFDAQLIHISAVGTNATDAGLKVGTSLDDDEIFTVSDGAFGRNGVPNEFDISDWRPLLNSQGLLTAGQIVLATIDYDGVAGTAIQNATLVLTFTRR